MKKILLFMIFVLTFSIAGCKSKDEDVKITFVTFNEKTVETYHVGDKVEFKNPKEYDGYKFIGWTLNDEIITDYTVTKEDVTFTAKFEKTTSIVTFNNDGKVTSKVYNIGSLVEFPEVTKEGYIFLGWTLNGEIVKNYTVTSSDVTFVAEFELHDNMSNAKKHLTDLIPQEVSSDINLPTSFDGVTIAWRSTNLRAINAKGKVTRLEYDVTVTLTAKLSYDGKNEDVKFKVVVPKMEDKDILNLAIKDFKFTGKINNQKVYLKPDFSTSYNKILTSWSSSNKDIIDDEGNVLVYPNVDTKVTFTLTLTLNEETLTRTFDVLVEAVNKDELVNLALSSENIRTVVNSDKVYLPTEFEFNLKGKWTSSNPEIITNDGIVKVFNKQNKVTMNLKITNENGEIMKDINYEFKINVKNVLPIVHADEFNPAKMKDVYLNNGYLVLNDGKTIGEYESDILSTLAFTSVIGTWDALTSESATVEFLVKARVNGTWSNYITYCAGGWGQGLNNASSNQNNGTIRLSDDEILVNNGNKADAIMFKLILRRKSAEVLTPKVSLVSFALNVPGYAGMTIDRNTLPQNVKHNVPRLYQHDVPGIGGIICSATSSTMLLKYKGMNFKDKDSLEHRYIAKIVREYGSGIYGNWVYNCVGMASFGFNSYVERMYSIDELLYHLANIGPVACSMRGQMTSDVHNYRTAGHLICIIGYEINNGTLKLISNDPNVPGVECRYTETVFRNTWRDIVYVIE